MSRVAIKFNQVLIRLTTFNDTLDPAFYICEFVGKKLQNKRHYILAKNDVIAKVLLFFLHIILNNIDLSEALNLLTLNEVPLSTRSSKDDIIISISKLVQYKIDQIDLYNSIVWTLDSILIAFTKRQL